MKKLTKAEIKRLDRMEEVLLQLYDVMDYYKANFPNSDFIKDLDFEISSLRCEWEFYYGEDYDDFISDF
jgi:hypothetical protein